MAVKPQSLNAPESCWICSKQFLEHGGTDSSVRQHEHHIIPRCYGGVDGPTVYLCTGHHDLLHAIGTKLIHGKPYFQLLGSDPEINNRLLYLASRVQQAHALFSEDPNKRMVQSTSFTRGTHAKLSALAKQNKLSKASMLQRLIEAEYSKLFPQRKS